MEKQVLAIWFSLTQYTWTLSRCIQNLKKLAYIRAERSVTEISIREKEKWTNKGTDKRDMADSFLHNTTYHTQCLYQISSSYVKQFLRNF